MKIPESKFGMHSPWANMLLAWTLNFLVVTLRYSLA